jgi:hypothetical protein
MKNYIGISRDHSGSMSSLATTAMNDYNLNVSSIKEGANTTGIDTVVSVIKCGVGSPAKNEFEVINSSVNSLNTLRTYSANGSSTPLFDSVGELIEQLQRVPDAAGENVSFLVMVITDGEENASRKFTAGDISHKIRQLQSTDRWTFTFRVPKGYARKLSQLGIPEENILEWEVSKRGFEEATVRTQTAVSNYYSQRSRGLRASSRFYSDLSSVTTQDVKSELKDITHKVQFFSVNSASPIREFLEGKLGRPMILGTAFYQLNKPEKLQSHKSICIRDRKSGRVYTGSHARDLLNLPKGGEIKIYPGDHGDFDVFIQSTSVNRNLFPGTDLLYYPTAGSI